MFVSDPDRCPETSTRFMEDYMKEFRVKGAGEQYLKVTKETGDGYSVVITRVISGWKEETKEFMPRSLFETCLRTEYLIPLGA